MRCEEHGEWNGPSPCPFCELLRLREENGKMAALLRGWECEKIKRVTVQSGYDGDVNMVHWNEFQITRPDGTHAQYMDKDKMYNALLGGE